MKLAVIGGCGSRSVMLAKSLAQQAGELGITEVVFMDIDEERVRVFGAMVEEVFKQIAPKVKKRCTTDAKSAVNEADFIITTIRAGKEQSRITDERIALKHGVIGQETTGVGGFGMALRSIPTLLEYCRLIKEYAKPEVMVFNFTNPAGLVTQALHDCGYNFVYGICDAPSGFLRQVATLYNIEVKELAVRLIGLNHLSYFTSVKKQGQEMLKEILDNPLLYSETDMRYFEPELAKHIGCMLNEYLYYYYYREKALMNMQQIGQTRGERIKDINDKMLSELGKYDVQKDFEKMLEIYSHYTLIRESDYMQAETAVARDEKSIPKFDLYTDDEGGYAGVALALMRAKITGERGEMILCIPNGEVIPWLEKNDIIEVSCNISREGAKPKRGEYKLPKAVKELIKTVKFYEREAAQAIIEHDIVKAIDTLMLHPLVSSYSLAKAIVEDYFKAYQEYSKGGML